jgi:hypothetical protein
VKERPLVKSLAAEQCADAALGVLSHFRVQFYDCLYTRADALFELTDAMLCSDDPVTSLVELTLTAEHRRGHGAMYDAVNHGWLEPRRLRRLLTSTPRAADGRIVLAADVNNWLRPDTPQPGAAVLPRLRTRPQRRSVHPRLALLLRRRAGDGTHVLDGRAGRDPAGAV